MHLSSQLSLQILAFCPFDLSWILFWNVSAHSGLKHRHHLNRSAHYQLSYLWRISRFSSWLIGDGSRKKKVVEMVNLSGKVRGFNGLRSEKMEKKRDFQLSLYYVNPYKIYTIHSSHNFVWLDNGQFFPY